jgi:hypothetical protein
MTNSEIKVKEWLETEVSKLRSEDQILDWLTLREAINDKALMSISDDVFVTHMQLMYLQLLIKCSVKLCSGGLGAFKRDPEAYIARMDAITEPISTIVDHIENGEYLRGLYSDAWGSSTDKAVRAMLQCFQSLSLSGRMSEQTLEALDRQICAAFVAYGTASAEAHGKAKGGNIDLQKADGKSSQGSSVNTQGNGCIIFVAIGVASFWEISRLICSS